MTSNHNYIEPNLLPYDEINQEKIVLIEENVGVATNISIVLGVIIGEGAVVATGQLLQRMFLN